MTYNYNSTDPIKITLAELDERKRFLLDKSKRFCMLPWIHLHASPDGDVYPCCHSMNIDPIGSVKTHTLEQVWNDEPQRHLRQNMLAEQPSKSCRRCYEQEDAGFFSGRKSSNKHFGHYIHKIDATLPDGTVPNFEMTYWDIRFSNLCNLKCRSCGHIFSSQWYQDQAKLAGPVWKAQNKVLNYAGRTETDMWEQLEPHLEFVEQIYFAGGEPLLMEEHYRILEELIKRGLTDVRLIYNTNFTHTDLKGRSVFEYWRQFKSVAVGASLDDSGARGEYIRKGTVWSTVEQNRRDMLATCPDVDFYISPTLSIMNARHLPEFHRDWVAKGLIKPQDLNVNILQDPQHYRIDIAPAEYKAELTGLYLDHIAWLRDQDPLHRAVQGFVSAVNFMEATDNSHLIDTFWRKTNQLDEIRKENILEVIPELKALK
jgi:radical SAM protein with 4Fe4S-binding SPASM domain